MPRLEDASDVLLGSTPVDAMYARGEQVWPMGGVVGSIVLQSIPDNVTAVYAVLDTGGQPLPDASVIVQHFDPLMGGTVPYPSRSDANGLVEVIARPFNFLQAQTVRVVAANDPLGIKGPWQGLPVSGGGVAHASFNVDGIGLAWAGSIYFYDNGLCDELANPGYGSSANNVDTEYNTSGFYPSSTLVHFNNATPRTLQNPPDNGGIWNGGEFSVSFIQGAPGYNMPVVPSHLHYGTPVVGQPMPATYVGAVPDVNDPAQGFILARSWFDGSRHLFCRDNTDVSGALPPRPASRYVARASVKPGYFNMTWTPPA